MTLASMTGFGRARGRVSDRLEASVVVRAVNHRYLDVQLRTNLREELPELEAAVRQVVAQSVRRGRVTVQLNLLRSAPSPARVMVDSELVTSALEQLASIELPPAVARSMELRDVLALPGVVTVIAEETTVDDDETQALSEIASEAVAAFDRMRCEEGARLGLQIAEELAGLESFLDWFDTQAASFRDALHSRLRARIDDLVGGSLSLDGDRLAQEAAILADRADVAEEVVRLRSHLATFRGRLDTGGAVGRALDFLCQEIHRELNTMGSKTREIGVADRLVDAKTATERIREQVQNLE